MNATLYRKAIRLFREQYGCNPHFGAYAPGRIEILGNHTDYNEGFVLSCAIDRGTVFLIAHSDHSASRLTAGDIMKEVALPPAPPEGKPPGNPVFTGDETWAEYVRGMRDAIAARAGKDKPFLGLFLGNVPLGAGLSSSAALEMSAGLALLTFHNVRMDKPELARVGQAAENQYVGVQSGLLDQISSLYGKANHLVLTDFRSLNVETVPLPSTFCFLVCNSGVRHSLVDSEYNARREQCESAVSFFASTLDHPVSALRDVSMEEWERYAGTMDDITRRRAAHILGENDRVQKAARLLRAGEIRHMGELLFASHESSRVNFENSCHELDVLVDVAKETEGVLGARLSGGGFGGSVIALVQSDEAEAAAKKLIDAFETEFHQPCDVQRVTAAEGAQVNQSFLADHSLSGTNA